MHKFKELKVYQKALIFTVTVREITKKFPKIEIFGLTSQFKRAADSIVLNIPKVQEILQTKNFLFFLIILFGPVLNVLAA